MRKLIVASDFSDTPGGRTPKEGEFSGEEFRDNVLEPAYRECLVSNEVLTVDFDGCYGFGTSFLEEAFGGLVRKYKYMDVLSHLELIANDDETILINVPKYIKTEEQKIK
jgi:hypothetical protein